MDRSLVVRAQNGDRGAFEALATTLYGRLHRIAYTILRDVGLAEDAAQQTMLRIWTELPRLRDPDRFDGWAHRILVNNCYREGGRLRRWLPDAGGVAEEPVLADETQVVLDRDQLDRGFRRLSVEHRTVLVLVYHADLPLECVAEALDVPVGTVKSRLHRAIRRLRAELEADAREPVSRSEREAAR
jgi:RNA polymerase sigma-70 factor, ECF subfamily